MEYTQHSIHAESALREEWGASALRRQHGSECTVWRHGLLADGETMVSVEDDDRALPLPNSLEGGEEGGERGVEAAHVRLSNGGLVREATTRSRLVLSRERGAERRLYCKEQRKNEERDEGVRHEARRKKQGARSRRRVWA